MSKEYEYGYEHDSKLMRAGAGDWMDRFAASAEERAKIKEQNVMKLKEKINIFMKGQNIPPNAITEEGTRHDIALKFGNQPLVQDAINSMIQDLSAKNESQQQQPQSQPQSQSSDSENDSYIKGLVENARKFLPQIDEKHQEICNEIMKDIEDWMVKNSTTPPAAVQITPTPPPPTAQPTPPTVPPPTAVQQPSTAVESGQAEASTLKWNKTAAADVTPLNSFYSAVRTILSATDGEIENSYPKINENLKIIFYAIGEERIAAQPETPAIGTDPAIETPAEPTAETETAPTAETTPTAPTAETTPTAPVVETSAADTAPTAETTPVTETPSAEPTEEPAPMTAEVVQWIKTRPEYQGFDSIDMSAETDEVKRIYEEVKVLIGNILNAPTSTSAPTATANKWYKVAAAPSALERMYKLLALIYGKYPSKTISTKMDRIQALIIKMNSNDDIVQYIVNTINNNPSWKSIVDPNEKLVEFYKTHIGAKYETSLTDGQKLTIVSLITTAQSGITNIEVFVTEVMEHMNLSGQNAQDSLKELKTSNQLFAKITDQDEREILTKISSIKNGADPGFITQQWAAASYLRIIEGGNIDRIDYADDVLNKLKTTYLPTGQSLSFMDGLLEEAKRTVDKKIKRLKDISEKISEARNTKPDMDIDDAAKKAGLNRSEEILCVRNIINSEKIGHKDKDTINKEYDALVDQNIKELTNVKDELARCIQELKALGDSRHADKSISNPEQSMTQLTQFSTSLNTFIEQMTNGKDLFKQASSVFNLKKNAGIWDTIKKMPGQVVDKAKGVVDNLSGKTDKGQRKPLIEDVVNSLIKFNVFKINFIDKIKALFNRGDLNNYQKAEITRITNLYNTTLSGQFKGICKIFNLPLHDTQEETQKVVENAQQAVEEGLPSANSKTGRGSKNLPYTSDGPGLGMNVPPASLTGGYSQVGQQQNQQMDLDQQFIQLQQTLSGYGKPGQDAAGKIYDIQSDMQRAQEVRKQPVAPVISYNRSKMIKQSSQEFEIEDIIELN